MKITTQQLRTKVIDHLHGLFAKEVRLTDGKMKKLAFELGGDEVDLGLFYEYAELAWTLWYRKLARRMVNECGSGCFDINTMTDFYLNVQPSFNYSDSNKRIFQQYSTPGPIGVMAGLYCKLEENHLGKKRTLFEPSAGNGLLTVLAPVDQVWVNEIDKTRLSNLKYQNYIVTTQYDASKPFKESIHQKFDAVISNPPFGTLPEVSYEADGFKITKLDHLMLVHALEVMKNNGRAALIIGDWTKFKGGKIANARPFFNWLGRFFWIDDIINIDSRKLYNKQGTAYPVRMILIGGRKNKPFGGAPTLDEMPRMAEHVNTFEELFERVTDAESQACGPRETIDDTLRRTIEMINTEMK